MTSPHASARATAVPKTPATIIAIATYVIVAGIFTQSGVILGPAAASFHASLADTAVLFSYLYAGNLGGISASLFAFSALTIRQVLFTAYGVFFAGVALMAATRQLQVAFAAAVLIGLGAGTGLSAGAVILAKTYADRQRAIAFLGTDCAFSAAGYVVPSLTGVTIAAGWRWQSGYLLVTVLPVVLLAASIWIRFPAVGRSATVEFPAARAALEPAIFSRSAYIRIALFAVALSLYLTGQTVFTIWAPTYLQSHFRVPALQAGGIIGTFFGASSLGLITAALLVTRIAPRAVLAVSITLAVLLTLALTRAPSAGLFFGLTTVFGFTSTCMFKLMISIGSEQIPSSPPQLVTLLLLCSGLGGIAAPALSAPVVKTFGPHAGLDVCALAYAAAFAFVIAALWVERGARIAAGKHPQTGRSAASMDADSLRAVQAPIKDRYRIDPAAALITLGATGTLDDPQGLSCSVETGRALVTAGLHPATGGDGMLACSGDMLLQALVACAGVTLRAVATSTGIPIRGGAVHAQGDLDFRGTLGVDRAAPVGFTNIRLTFDLDTDATPEQIATLKKLTERYCVVYQSLASGVVPHTEFRTRATAV